MKLSIKIIFISLVSVIGVMTNSVYALQLDEHIEEIFSNYASSIVLVGVEGNSDQKIGSGFVVDEDGLILTNYHILHQAQKVYVKLKNNKAYLAQVVEADPQNDIAVLRIRRSGLRAVKLGNSKHVDIGQRVVTIGHPLGLQNTISDGLISSVRKLDNGRTLLQISVPLSPGSSGGPLFDLHGKVVGITTSSFDGGQNLNFAVPINYAKSLLRKIEDKPARKPLYTEKFVKKDTVDKPRMLAMNENVESLSYVIQSNDTLFSLAKRFHTTVEALKTFNHLSDSRIYSGQIIQIPSPK